jgi:polysaccharide biosynthesis protein PslH
VDERLFAVEPARASEPRLMFLGNLSVPHNVDAAVYAAREVLPRVRAVRPDATLWLVGAAPRPEVQALAEAPGVTVTGALPDLAPVLAAAHVMVAPLRFSSGIQNKVLEAMAAGLPVVTTSGVAGGVPGSEGLLRAADDADGLSREVLALLADPAAAAAQAERARAHARAHFSWDALARELERVVREAQSR